RHAPPSKSWHQSGNFATVVKRDSDFGSVSTKLSTFSNAQIPVAQYPQEIPQLLVKAMKC
ncbi:CoA-binding protein, partial [Cylindrospermopsis raciborskii CS-506_A]|nr:CoA-binding protein [Cylindrospermopsis raciborskii CS-506_A]